MINRKRNNKIKISPAIGRTNKTDLAYDNYRQNHIFQANMQALNQYHPDIVRILEKCAGGNEYEIVRAHNGIPNLYLHKLRDFYYSQDNPLADARKQLQSLNLKNTRMALFFGIGLGYEALEYGQHFSQEQQTNYILIVEKDPLIFISALRSVDLTPLLTHPCIDFMVGVQENGLYTCFRDYLGQNSRFVLLKAANPVYHISSMRLYKDYYLKALQVFREAATHQILYYGNDPYDSLVGVENMLGNLNEIIANPGINMLYDKFQGRPAVVVATGPSLNKNKHLLKGLEDKALIIAADASLKVMIEMGVKPHLVTSLERGLPTVKLLEGFSPEQVEDVYLAACPVVRPEMYQAYPGPRIIVYRTFDHFKWLDIDKGMLGIKLSAGNMAFKVAEALGCNPIILIGQDLAFSREGTTHATGSLYGEKQNFFYQQETIDVPGNDGQPIKTTHTWYSFLKSYEMDISTYKGECINSTEGGAYINGTRVMPFKEAIDQYITEDFHPLEIIKKNLQPFYDEGQTEDVQKTLVLIEETIKDLEEVVANCKQGLTLYEEYKGELESCLQPETAGENGKHLKEIHDQIMACKKECGKSYRTFQLFFTHIFQSFNIKFEIEITETPAKYDNALSVVAAVVLKQAEWFAVIGDLAGICIKSLQKAYQEVQSMEQPK